MKVDDTMALDSHIHINKLILNEPQKYIDDINKDPSIESVINVGLNIETSKDSVLISKKNQKFYSAIGIHPLYIESQNINDLYNLSQNDKVVAIGEIGLDSTHQNFYEQKQYLIKQIINANELNLPVIIHSNNTNKLIIDIFEKVVKPKYGCVFHCFQRDIDDLKYLTDNNYYISFAGKITYKNAKKSIEIAKIVSNDLFLVESDRPYISPEPFRNEINKSANIHFIINKLAEIKEMSYKEIENLTSQNAKRLFKQMK